MIRKHSTRERARHSPSRVIAYLFLLAALSGGSLHAHSRPGAPVGPGPAPAGPLPDLFVTGVQQALGYAPKAGAELRTDQGYWIVVDVKNQGGAPSAECLTRVEYTGPPGTGVRELRTPGLAPGEVRMLSFLIPLPVVRVTTEVDAARGVAEASEENNRETWDFVFHGTEPLPRTLTGTRSSGSTVPISTPCPDLPRQENLDEAIKKKEAELKAAMSAWRSTVSLVNRLQGQYLDALKEAKKAWWKPATEFFWLAEAVRLKAELWGAKSAEKAAWALVETRQIELECLKKKK